MTYPFCSQITKMNKICIKVHCAKKGMSSYVQFIVDYNGEVSNAIVIKGVDPMLDKEAIRVTKSSLQSVGRDF